jgi:polysaccharide biosynthesis transport protein
MVSQPVEGARPSHLMASARAIHPGEDDVDIARARVANLFARVSRHRYACLAVLVAWVAVAIWLIQHNPPRYEAAAELVIGKNQSGMAKLSALVPDLPQDLYTNETEAAILHSRMLLTRLVDRLMRDPNEKAVSLLKPPPTPLDAAWDAITSVPRQLGWLSDSTALAAPGQGDGATQLSKSEAIAYLQTNLKVAASDRSRVLTVRFASVDPEFSATVVNGLVQLYFQRQSETKEQANNAATDWLTQRAEETRAKLIEAERRLEAARSKAGLFAIGGIDLLERQMADVQQQLVSAQVKRSEADSLSDQLNRVMRSEGRLDSTSASVNSQLIQHLREQETGVIRKLGELRTQLREGHPRMQLLVGELADLRQKIAEESRNILSAAGYDARVAHAREQNLQAKIADLKQEISGKAEAEANLRSLESEMRTEKQLYDTLLGRLREATVNAQAAPVADAEIISLAEVPRSPVGPGKPLWFAMALLTGIGAAWSVAFGLDLLHRGCMTLAEAQAVTGGTPLGLVPRLGRKTSLATIRQRLLDDPDGDYAEAVRSIWAALQLIGPEGSHGTTMVTSSVPGEGKSSLTLSLGIVAARAGRRALVIDADLRRPTILRALGLSAPAGLAELLTGRATLDSAITIDPLTGLHVIDAGRGGARASSVLGTEACAALIATLQADYDAIFLDLPPVLHFGDGLLIQRHVPRVAFVVQWDETPNPVIEQAVTRLTARTEHSIGVVLSQVDPRHYPGYGYYYYSADRPRDKARRSS